MSAAALVLSGTLTWSDPGSPAHIREVVVAVEPLAAPAALRRARRLPLQPSTQPRPDPARRGRHSVWRGTAGWATTREAPGDNPVAATLLVTVRADGACDGVWVEDHREIPLSWASAAGSCGPDGWSLALRAWADEGLPAATGHLALQPVQRP